MIAGILIAVGAPESLETTFDRTIPTITPMIPPILVSMAASVRNWKRMTFFLAPIAFFRPISLVRSVTDTSMMFITPIPPTSREILAIQISCVLVLSLSFCIFLTCCITSSALYLNLEEFVLIPWFITSAAAFPAELILSVESARITAFCGSSN